MQLVGVDARCRPAPRRRSRDRGGACARSRPRARPSRLRDAAPSRSSRTRSSRCAATTSNARAASATWIAMSASVSASGSMFMVASAKNFTSFFSSIMYMPVARLHVGADAEDLQRRPDRVRVRRGQPGDQAVGVAAPHHHHAEVDAPVHEARGAGGGDALAAAQLADTRARSAECLSESRRIR